MSITLMEAARFNAFEEAAMINSLQGGAAD